MESTLFWPSIKLAHWHAFVTHVANPLPAVAGPPSYLFRGVPDENWGLEPALARVLRGISTTEKAIDIELATLKEPTSPQRSIRIATA